MNAELDILGDEVSSLTWCLQLVTQGWWRADHNGVQLIAHLATVMHGWGARDPQHRTIPTQASPNLGSTAVVPASIARAGASASTRTDLPWSWQGLRRDLAAIVRPDGEASSTVRTDSPISISTRAIVPSGRGNRVGSVVPNTSA